MYYVLHKNDFTPEVRSQLPKPFQQLLDEERVFIATLAEWQHPQYRSGCSTQTVQELITEDCG